MFRDETVKVEKKVRASWGREDGVASSSTSSPTDASVRQGPDKTKRSSSMASSATPSSLYVSTPSPSFASISPTSPNSPSVKGVKGGSVSPLTTTGSPTTTRLKFEGWDSSKLPPAILTDPAELGLTFYVNRYIIGYPDEVRKAEDLSSQTWFQSSSSQTTMAALGLAGMANLHDDRQLQHLSRIKYGEALALTNSALHNPLQNLEAAIKTTVMLALFQCVHATHESHDNVRVHLLGCLALIRSALPVATAPTLGIRGVLQLCYSLLIPCVTSGVSLPENFFDWLLESKTLDLLPGDEKPGAELVSIIARFARLSATLRTTTLSDGHEATEQMLQQMLAVDAEMEGWESSQQGTWKYEVVSSPDLPREAVFRGSYHRYSDVWSSRIWNHLRWARLLANQQILELAAECPRAASGAAGFKGPPGPIPFQEDRVRETVRRLAVDVLTSVPTHYRHPRLSWEELDMVQTHGGAGSGAFGIPHLTFQLRVAACAPGVPYDVWRWALDTLETIWSELGMLHAKSLAEVLRRHRDKLDGEIAAGTKVKVERDADTVGKLPLRV
ncbi:hypothetical protein DHEL01_v208391 [Diaporthe helianthi]|uniref:C6 zinc finger domain-containing protein n=1 Tax=Diaporthe helianthi TaxID=158607 RepID=A0A2P5HSJ9_DIAHE|nr:hypothetical protein DHEL01_v208391 [Diaporthe helianthi]